MTTRLPIAPSEVHRPDRSERDRLEQVLLSVDAALEQLLYAHMAAAAGTVAGEPSADLRALDRLVAETTAFRNVLRERAMRLMGRTS